MKIAVLKLSNKTVPFIIQKVRDIVTAITNASGTFTVPIPTLITVSNQVDILELAFQAAINGGKNLKAQVRIEKKQMLFLMAVLQAYVNNTCQGDETLLLSSGYDVKSVPNPVGILPPPANVRSVYGEHVGEIIVRWNGVPKRTGYRVQMSSTDTQDSSFEDLPNGNTGKRRLVVDGLIPGQVYFFRILAISTAGFSGPSDITSHRAA